MTSPRVPKGRPGVPLRDRCLGGENDGTPTTYDLEVADSGRGRLVHANNEVEDAERVPQRDVVSF